MIGVRTVAIAVAIGSLTVLCGCGDLDLQKRSKATLEFFQTTSYDTSNHASTPLVETNAAIVAYLSKATTGDLRSPHMVYAYVDESPRGIVLIVHWIEDKPTVEGIVLHRGQDKKRLTLTSPEDGWVDNRKRAKSGVFYSMMFWFLEQNPKLAEMRTLDESCKVSLIVNGKPVNEALQLRVFRRGSAAATRPDDSAAQTTRPASDH